MQFLEIRAIGFGVHLQPSLDFGWTVFDGDRNLDFLVHGFSHELLIVVDIPQPLRILLAKLLYGHRRAELRLQNLL